MTMFAFGVEDWVLGCDKEWAPSPLGTNVALVWKKKKLKKICDGRDAELKRYLIELWSTGDVKDKVQKASAPAYLQLSEKKKKSVAWQHQFDSYWCGEWWQPENLFPLARCHGLVSFHGQVSHFFLLLINRNQKNCEINCESWTDRWLFSCPFQRDSTSVVLIHWSTAQCAVMKCLWLITSTPAAIFRISLQKNVIDLLDAFKSSAYKIRGKEWRGRH